MATLCKDRGKSSAQFLETARKLEKATIANCIRFPKRYTHLLTSGIVQLAIDVLNEVKSGNSIYPVNQHEVQMRRDCFTRANNALQCLITQVSVAQELEGVEIRETSWSEWFDLMEEEAVLIAAVKKNDRERYKNLP